MDWTWWQLIVVVLLAVNAVGLFLISPKLFDSLNLSFGWKGGRKNQKQNVRGGNNANVVASQAHGAPSTAGVTVQAITERHGVVRTPNQLFGDFDHAIRNYGEKDDLPPALLVTDWDITIIQMCFRDGVEHFTEHCTIEDGQICYKKVPLRHPMAGPLAMTDQAQAQEPSS